MIELNIQRFADDGVIVIGTKLDRKNLDKDLAKVERDLQKFADEGEKLATRKQKLEIDTSKTENKIEKLMNKLSELDTKSAQIQMGKQAKEETLIPENLAKDAEYQKLLAQEEAINMKAQETYNELELQKTQLIAQQNEYDKINSAITDNEQKQVLQAKAIEDARNKTKGLNIEMDKVGKGIDKAVKKVAKWGLALFAIRSVYSTIRQAMSTISQYNEDLQAKINGIKMAIASALEPAINWIVNAVYKLVQYLGYLLKSWLGIDIFKKSAKSMQSGAKSAKEMNKSLAGFDEMNVVQDNSSSGGGGTGAKLEPLKDSEIPSWLVWIKNNGKTIAALLVGIATGLTLIKLGVASITAMGFGIVLAGIILLIQDIIDFINDPSWENFIAVLGDIMIVVGGLILLLTGSWWGILIAFVGLIVKLVAENWETIKGILGAVWGWVMDHIITPIYNMFKPFFDFFINLFTTIWENVKIIVMNFVEIFKAVFELIKAVFSPIVDFFGGIWNKVKDKLKAFATKVSETISGVFKGVINVAIGAIESFLNKPIQAINFLMDLVNKIPGVNLSPLQEFHFPRLAVGGIVNMPGKGVNYGGANIGERGPEGVIPLTNEAMMEELGKAIGKNVVINASITNSMDGRVISRQLKQINNNDSFAFNN